MRGTALLVTALTALFLVGASVGQTVPDGPPPYDEEWAQNALDLAQEAGMFGSTSYDPETGVLSGGFVRAVLDSETGRLTDYALVAGVVTFPVFSQVVVSPPGQCTRVANGPASLLFDCSAFTLRTHNDPTRALLYEAVTGPVEVTFTGADGSFLTRQDGSVLVAGMGFQGQVTLLRADGSAVPLPQPSEGTLTVSLETNSKVVFRASPQEDEGAVGRWAQGAVFASLAQGRLGAELFLVSLEDGLLEDAVPYRDLAFDAGLQDGAVVVAVTSDFEAGTLVALNLHRGVLDVTDLGDLEVRLDGEVVARTDNVDGLAAAVPEGPAYYAAAGSNGLFLLVHVDHFSSRTLTIQKLARELFQPVSEGVLLLVGLGALATVLAAAVLLRRGRDEW